MKDKQDLASLTQRLSAEYKLSDSPQEPQGTPESLFSYQRVLEAERRILGICAKYGIDMETRWYERPLSLLQRFPATSTAVLGGAVVVAASFAEWYSLVLEGYQSLYAPSLSDGAVLAFLGTAGGVIQSAPAVLVLEISFLFDYFKNDHARKYPR